MISIDKERGSRTSLKGYTVPSTRLYLEGSGSGDAGRRIWKPAMEEYLKGKPAESFPSPPADLVRGSRDNITATILFFAPPSSSPAAAPATATATTATPGALAVLASPPRTRPDSLRRCCSATFSSETDVPSSSSDDRTTQHR